MTIKVPDTLDQAAAEKLIRDLATSHNTREEQMSALREANQRMEERLASVGQHSPAAEACARYVRGDKVLLRGLDVFEDGTTRDSGYSEADREPVLRIPGYLDDTAPKTDEQREMQRLVNARNVIRQIKHAANVRKGEAHIEPKTPMLDSEIRRVAEYLPEPLRRTFNGSSGTGSQWIPTDVYPEIMMAASQLYERMVPGLFPEIMVARNGTLPLLTTGFLPYIQSAPGADPAKLLSSDVATNETTYSLKTLAAMTMIGEDASEESLFAVMPFFNERMAYALVSVEEDAIINGQASTTSVDTGLAAWNPDSFWAAAPGGASNDHRKAFDGLRHLSVDGSRATDRSTFTYATFLADRGSIHGPISQSGSVVCIGSRTGLSKNLYALDQVATQEKYGMGASVFAGAVKNVAGVDILESQFMTDDLNATGIFDNSTKTKTGAVLALRAGFARITRYGVRITTQTDNTRGIIYLVGKTRRDFKQVYSSDVTTRYLYNMAKS
jgi:hypothetical protein